MNRSRQRLERRRRLQRLTDYNMVVFALALKCGFNYVFIAGV